MFLLKILCRRCDLGKCLFSALKNIFPMLVVTASLYGGLKYMHLRFLAFFLFVFGWSFEVPVKFSFVL